MIYIISRAPAGAALGLGAASFLGPLPAPAGGAEPILRHPAWAARCCASLVCSGEAGAGGRPHAGLLADAAGAAHAACRRGPEPPGARGRPEGAPPALWAALGLLWARPGPGGRGRRAAGAARAAALLLAAPWAEDPGLAEAAADEAALAAAGALGLGAGWAPGRKSGA